MCEANIWKFEKDGDLFGYTFIIPSVAVGNVGQLTCDFLISTLGMVKIASVHSPALIPVLGYDPYDLNSSKLCSTCEIYKCAARNLVVLQLRAPVLYKHARTFLDEIVKKFKERNVKDIVILSSSFAHEKKQISTSPFRYLVNDLSSFKSKVKTLDNWIEHEAYDTELIIYGGGFSALLYEICKDNNMPCLMLYKYCSEGNNIPDAVDMIHYLANILPLFSDKTDIMSQLVQPVSWRLLFGRPPPKDIY